VTTVSADISQIVAGGNSTCVVTSAGALSCFGRNDHGQLGDGTTTNRSVAVTPVGMDANVAGVSPDSLATCAVKTDGSVYCWGNSAWGVLGYFSDGGDEDVTTPRRVDGVTGAVAVRVRGRHACAVLQTGELVLWGDFSIDPTAYLLRPPGPLTGFANVKDVALGDHHLCALLADGSVQCEGDNTFGQLGDRTMNPSSAPVDVTSLP